MKDQTVTTIVHHQIKSGMEEEFHSWLSNVRAESQKFEGYLDSSLINKDDSSSGEFVSLFRFDNYSNLKAWVTSEQHNKCLEDLKEISSVEAKLNSYEGLEFWFDRGSPNTLLMSLITYIGLLPLVLIIPPILEKTTPLTGTWLISIGTAVSVLFMSYLVMPALNKLFARFL